METLRGLRDKPAQRGSLIQKRCFNQRILNHSSSIQHDPQTVRKAGRTEIRLNEVVNWLPALNESDGARAISKRLSDAFGGMHLKCTKQIGIGHDSSNTHQYAAYTE